MTRNRKFSAWPSMSKPMTLVPVAICRGLIDALMPNAPNETIGRKNATIAAAAATMRPTFRASMLDVAFTGVAAYGEGAGCVAGRGADAGAASWLPHLGQNFEPSGIWVPHLGQNMVFLLGLVRRDDAAVPSNQSRARGGQKRRRPARNRPAPRIPRQGQAPAPRRGSTRAR